MSLRPPLSPSPSPGPPENGKTQTRQSLGPGRTLTPGSPRLASGGGTRPTSELLGSSGMYQTPEAEALDQWFENLQNYEATLEDMAAASLDVNFKEELSAIEQWFKVLSEAERTAALYSLLQHSTQVQIRFFITVLQQMARSDPMTALLSPAVGGSMQAQMEAKLASLKSPGLKSGLPASPTARNFTAAANNRQSMLDPPPSAGFLSPDVAQSQDATHLAQQRAKLKASANAAHRISAPIMSSPVDRTWGTGGLTQVSEGAGTGAATPGEDGDKGRPKSTEFSGRSAPAPAQEATVPASHESWASMVTTPLPMFPKSEPKEQKQAEWKTPGAGAVPGVPRMGDPTIHRRGARQTPDAPAGNMYDDNGNFVGGTAGGQTQQRPMGRWNNNPVGSPASASGRFGASDDGRGSNNGGYGGNNPNNGGMPFGAMGMGMNGMNMPNMQNMLAMGISPETQLLAAQMAQAQMAAMGGMGGMPGMAGMGWMGNPGMGMGMNNRMGMGMGMGNMMGRSPQSARTPRSANSMSSRMDTPKSSGGGGEEDVDPALLNDVPAWLRSLRLHKYMPNFEGSNWREMVMMSEEQLEAKGVAALGARRKMLKTFEVVRKKMGIEGGPPPLPA